MGAGAGWEEAAGVLEGEAAGVVAVAQGVSVEGGLLVVMVLTLVTVVEKYESGHEPGCAGLQPPYSRTVRCLLVYLSRFWSR